MIKKILRAYQISMPETSDRDFIFSTSNRDGRFQFHFRWCGIESVWRLYVTMPDETVRNAGVNPNCTNWSGFLDFGLHVQANAEEITTENITSVTLYLIVWGGQ